MRRSTNARGLSRPLGAGASSGDFFVMRAICFLRAAARALLASSLSIWAPLGFSIAPGAIARWRGGLSPLGRGLHQRGDLLAPFLRLRARRCAHRLLRRGRRGQRGSAQPAGIEGLRRHPVDLVAEVLAPANGQLAEVPDLRLPAGKERLLEPMVGDRIVPAQVAPLEDLPRALD